jgi:hypothetical protein
MIACLRIAARSPWAGWLAQAVLDAQWVPAGFIRKASLLALMTHQQQSLAPPDQRPRTGGGGALATGRSSQ